jgi:hypothetical protein
MRTSHQLSKWGAAGGKACGESKRRGDSAYYRRLAQMKIRPIAKKEKKARRNFGRLPKLNKSRGRKP